MKWAIENVYIGPACENHCGGHGDCVNQRCFCDAGFSGSNCYVTLVQEVEPNCYTLDTQHTVAYAYILTVHISIPLNGEKSTKMYSIIFYLSTSNITNLNLYSSLICVMDCEYKSLTN